MSTFNPIAEARVREVYGLLAERRVEDADAASAKLADDFPGLAPVWRARAAARQAKGRAGEAVDAMRRAVELDPGSPQWRMDLGLLALSNDDLSTAQQALQASVQLHPELQQAWTGLGIASYRMGLDDAARDAFAQAHRLAPDDLAASRALAEAEFTLEHHADALPLFVALLNRFPDDLELSVRVARCESRLGRPERARDRCTSLLATQSSPELWLALGQAQEDLGERDAAASAYARALDLLPGWPEALGAMLMLQRGDASAELVEAANAALVREELPPQQRAHLNYGLGKTWDSRGRYAEAMSHWRAANESRRASAGAFDRPGLDATIALTKQMYSTELLERMHDSGNVDQRPVFVVGMPRSGTTLVEQVLATHPDVHGCGELTELVRIAASVRELQREPTATQIRAWSESYLAVASDGAAPDAARLVDKQPYNFLHVGLIALLFPQARVIWCRRDPRDIAVSIFSENFSPASKFATDLDDIDYVTRAQDALMRHWQATVRVPILDVQYEAVTADFEAQARRLIDFAGLPWREACLAFHDNRRAVQTFSRWQVRQPVHSRSVGRWRNYAEWLPPALRDAPTASGT